MRQSTSTGRTRSSLSNLVRDATDLGVIGHLQNRDRVHEPDEETAVVLLAHDHVARKQQTDVGLGEQCTVRQRRIASTENPVGPTVDSELGFHRGLDVDVGQDAESLYLQRLGHGNDGLWEGQTAQLAVETVARTLRCDRDP